MPRTQPPPTPEEAMFSFLRRRKLAYLHMASKGLKNLAPSLFATTFARASIKTDLPRGSSRIINLASGGWGPSGRVDIAYTNQLIQSEDPSTSWTAGDTTDADGSGTVAAWRVGGVSRLLSTTAAGGFRESSNFANKFTSANGTIYAFLAAGTAAETRLELWNATGAASVAIVSITWATGAIAVVSGTATVRIVQRGTNFVRLELNATAITTTNDHTMRIYPAGAGEGTCYYGGAQAEFGLVGHPYMPTTTVAVATVADALSANVGATTGTDAERTYILVWEQDYPIANIAANATLMLHLLHGGATVDSVQVIRNAAGTGWQVTVLDENVAAFNQTFTTAALVNAGRHCLVISVKSGNTNAWLDGVPATASASAIVHTASAPVLYIGKSSVATREFSAGRIRMLAVEDQALTPTNAQLLCRLCKEVNP